MKTIRRKVICKKCNKLRIVSYKPDTKLDKEWFVEYLKEYICTDCEK